MMIWLHDIGHKGYDPELDEVAGGKWLVTLPSGGLQPEESGVRMVLRPARTLDHCRLATARCTAAAPLHARGTAAVACIIDSCLHGARCVP